LYPTKGKGHINTQWWATYSSLPTSVQPYKGKYKYETNNDGR